MGYSPAKPGMAFIFKASVEIAPALELGQTPLGNRRIIHIRGGTVEGPELSGIILNGGADWQVVKEDGTAILEARYTIKTDDDALIYVRNEGYRHGPPEVLARIASGESVDPEQYYFRACPFFETAAHKYSWLNKTLCLSSGIREKDRVILDFYQVL